MSDELRALDILAELPERSVVGEGAADRLGRSVQGALAWWHRHLFERLGDDNPWGEPVEPTRRELRGSYSALEPRPRSRPPAAPAPAPPAPTPAPTRAAAPERPAPDEPVDRTPPRPGPPTPASRAGRVRMGRRTQATAPTVRKVQAPPEPTPAADVPPPPRRRELPKKDLGLDDLFGFSEGGRFKGD